MAILTSGSLNVGGSRSSLMHQLDLQLTDDGLIRVGTRLWNSSLSVDCKSPVLIPTGSKLIDLLVARSHYSVKHGGVSQTLAHFRLRYWILKGRAQVKKLL